MTLDELENRLKEIEETRETARAELAVLEVAAGAWRS